MLAQALIEAWRGLVRHRAFGGFVIAILALGAGSATSLVGEGARSWRLGATLFGLFGGLALTLAAAGLYGLLAFAVRQRTSEIGVRIALGANPASVARLVLGQGFRLVASGWRLPRSSSAWPASLDRGYPPSVPPRSIRWWR